MKKETGLIVAGNSKLGKALLAEALKLNNQDLQTQVVRTVRQLMSQIDRQKKQVENSKAAIKIMERRVVAIEAGKFTVDEHGSITFTEPALGKDQCFIVDCTQCGYPKTVVGKLM